MRLAYDATPAAVQRAGVGRYARELLKELLHQFIADEYVLQCAAPRETADQLLDTLPPGALRELRRLPIPERATTAVWHRLRLPLPVERLIGQFDLYHATDFVAPPTSRPLVVTIHDLSYLRVPQYGHPPLVEYLKRAVPRTLARADAVVTVSASVAADVAEAYPAVRDRIVAIPNGVTLPRGVPSTAAPQPTILIVGTLEPRKNHAVLLDAIDVVRLAVPEAVLVIAGRIGWQSDAIVARVREQCVQGSVRFIEAPDDDVLEQLYSTACLCVAPSHYEGFGLPVLEAMSHAKPVIASDILVHREVGAEVVSYCRPDDPAAWASTIIQLLQDQGARQMKGILGRARAETMTWSATAERTHRVYRRVLSES